MIVGLIVAIVVHSTKLKTKIINSARNDYQESLALQESKTILEDVEYRQNSESEYKVLAQKDNQSEYDNLSEKRIKLNKNGIIYQKKHGISVFFVLFIKDLIIYNY